MLRVLEERNFPVGNLRLLASSRSAGKTMEFKGEKYTVEELTHDSFKDIDIALFSAGASRSKEFAASAVKEGAVVVDNSSAFRMDEDVPLVVPEVNPEDVQKHNGIIANPNCSTIIMLVPVFPLHKSKKTETHYSFNIPGNKWRRCSGHGRTYQSVKRCPGGQTCRP